jgi:formylglycine-generating enzyme required for sulfatase activity
VIALALAQGGGHHGVYWGALAAKYGAISPDAPFAGVPVPVAIPPATVAAGAKKVNPKDGLTYVWIPPGSFMMGCSPGDAYCDEGICDEKPAHKVTITRGFWLGQTTVTQQAYQRVTGGNPSFAEGANLPVEGVIWNEAEAYCAAVGGRLPTEAEWEYAARAGSTGARYGNPDEIAWHNGGGQTHEVGQRLANAFGLDDMLGNVWQWVADWYGPYQARAQSDPSGPESGEFGEKVQRGGAWNDDPKDGRVSYRCGIVPGFRAGLVGFRCVSEWKAAAEAGTVVPRPAAPPAEPPIFTLPKGAHQLTDLDQIAARAATAYARQDYAAAAPLYQELAFDGRADAMTSLGYMYEKGLGMAQSDMQATAWYRKAAALGNEVAREGLKRLGR